MTIEALENYQPLIVLVMFVLTLLLETARPLVESGIPRWRHLGRNLGISVAAFVAFGATGFLKAGSSAWVTSHDFGLLNMAALPWAVRILVSFMVVDFTDYLFHRLQHGVSWIWRFHRVHHADSRLDASSSLRFHPVEGAAQTAYQAVAILLFGIRLDAMVLFDTVLLVFLYLQHANVNWPESIDRAARWVFVTPDVHHVHHSRDQRYTDSNFGDMFTIWDRLLGTYEEVPDRRAIAYGLAEFDADRYQTVKGMTLLPLSPFGRQ